MYFEAIIADASAVSKLVVNVPSTKKKKILNLFLVIRTH